jgi:glycosyltransferase involved in cell wall biosynthesis
MENNRVFFIIYSLGKGGAERILFDFINNLKLQSKITLFVIQNTNEGSYFLENLKSKPKFLFNKKINIYSFKFKVNKIFFLIFLPFFSFFIFIKVNISSYKLLIYNTLYIGLLGYFFSLFSFFLGKRQKHIEIFHTNLHVLPFFSKLIFFCSFFHKSLIICNVYASEVSKINRIFHNKKVIFIPFSVQTEAQSITHNFPFHEPLLICTISRLVKEKRVDFFINACNILNQLKFDFRFNIYGDGPEKSYLEKLINKHGLTHKVFLNGQIDNPVSILSKIDVFLVAMVGNSTGIAGLQAASLSKPILGYQTINGYIDNELDLKTFHDFNKLALEVIKIQNYNNYIDYINVVKNYFNQRKFSTFIENYSELFNSLLK